MNNWANALSSNNSPDKEADTSSWNDKGFDREKMTDLMDWEPDSRQRACPEDEESHKGSCVRSRAGNTVGYIGV
jgi:hypothetical protein